MLLWAIKTRAPSSSCKLLLQHMGFLAKEPQHKVYASVATLATATQLNAKTVEACLKRLTDGGLIRKLSARSGLGGAAVYELAGPTDSEDETYTEIGGASGSTEEREVHPILDGSSPNFSGKLPQISSEVPPKVGDKQKKRNTRDKQSGERSAPRYRLKEEWQPAPQTLTKAKSARPDLDLDAVLREFRGYWLANGKTMANWDLCFMNWVQRERSAQPQRVPSQRTFDGIDYEAPFK